MIVLGLDLASHTGYAVIVGGTEVRSSGTKTFKGKADKKFSDFSKWIDELLSVIVPDIVVYERPHFRGYAATAMGVGLSTLLRKACYEHGFPVIPVHTATLKKFATSYGKANKEQMTKGINTVFKDLKLETKENNDEADALWLALYGSKLTNDEIRTLQH